MDVQESSEAHGGAVEGGWKVSSTTVSRLLHELGYRLQSVRKSQEGTSPPERNAQFEHINAKADEFLQRHQPMVSVDTKKKELVGGFNNGGREWRPKGKPEKSLVHDFPRDAAGKAIPQPGIAGTKSRLAKIFVILSNISWVRD